MDLLTPLRGKTVTTPAIVRNLRTPYLSRRKSITLKDVLSPDEKDKENTNQNTPHDSSKKHSNTTNETPVQRQTKRFKQDSPTKIGLTSTPSIKPIQIPSTPTSSPHSTPLLPRRPAFSTTPGGLVDETNLNQYQEQHVNSLLQQNSFLQQQLTAAKQALETAKRDSEDANRGFNDSIQEKNLLKQEFEKKLKEVQKNQTEEISRLGARYEEVLQQLEDAKQDVLDSESQLYKLPTLESELDFLREQLSNEQKTIEYQKSEIKTLESKLCDQGSEVVKMMEQLSTLKSEKCSTEDIIHSLTQKFFFALCCGVKLDLSFRGTSPNILNKMCVQTLWQTALEENISYEKLPKWIPEQFSNHIEKSL